MGVGAGRGKVCSLLVSPDSEMGFVKCIGEGKHPTFNKCEQGFLFEETG